MSAPISPISDNLRRNSVNTNIKIRHFSPMIRHVSLNCINQHPPETLSPPLDLTVSLKLQSIQSGKLLFISCDVFLLKDGI